MEKEILNWIRYLAYAQGGIVIGLSIMIFYFYFRYRQGYTLIKVTVLLVSASYLLMALATIISIDRSMYEWGDPWYPIVGSGYLLGDIGLWLMYRIQVRRYFKTKNYE